MEVSVLFDILTAILMFIFTVVTSAPQFFGTTVQVSWQNLKILWEPAHKIELAVEIWAT